MLSVLPESSFQHGPRKMGTFYREPWLPRRRQAVLAAGPQAQGQVFQRVPGSGLGSEQGRGACLTPRSVASTAQNRTQPFGSPRLRSPPVEALPEVLSAPRRLLVTVLGAQAALCPLPGSPVVTAPGPGGEGWAAGCAAGPLSPWAQPRGVFCFRPREARGDRRLIPAVPEEGAETTGG